MGHVSAGWMGNGSSYTNMSTPVSLHVTMDYNVYPKGTFTLGNFGDSAARWMNPDGTLDSIYWFALYLCDSAGNNAYYLSTIKVLGGRMNSGSYSWNVNCPDLRGKALYMKAAKSTSGNLNLRLYNRAMPIDIDTATYSFSITVTQPSVGGTISCNMSSATPGTTVTLSRTAATGYTFKGWTFSTSVGMVSENQFTMPSSNVTVSATFEKTNYLVSTATNPSGAGIVSVSPGTANMGDQITISQTAGSGYYFNGWTTSPTVTISNNTFTMPASNVTVTANYLKRSTASLNNSTLEGGGTATLTIVADKSSYAHK